MSSGTASSTAWTNVFEFGPGHGPRTIVAIGAEFIILNDMTDLWDKAACLLSVDRDDRFGHCAEPAGIRGKPVAPDRLSPGRVVISAVIGGTLLLDDDPGVDRKNASPSHRARGIHANDRRGMTGCRRQKPGARAIRGLPIAAMVSRPVIAGGRRSDRHKNQQQEDDHEFSQGQGSQRFG